MLAVVVVYIGLITIFSGVLTLLKPPRLLRLNTRRAAVPVLIAGLLIVTAGILMPAPATAVPATVTLLDRFAPRYQFSEFHTLHVPSACDVTYRAIRSVTADEIFLFQTLTWLRRFGQSGPESILNSPGRMPLLDVATQTTFLQLAEEPGREIVIGTVVHAPAAGTRGVRTPVDYVALQSRPGYGLATMNFRLDTSAEGCTLNTETRVFATDPQATRRFAAYWRVIYPGSALIRRFWLQAIARRALSLPNNS